MKQIIKTLFNRLGVDGAIFYTSLSRILQAFAGVITIFFVGTFLNGVEQGFYYTFGSILAVQIFFELGLNGIITQYVAHEKCHLTWDDENNLHGPEYHLSRLSSLIHFAAKWYLSISAFLFVILVVTGLVFFRRYDSSNGTVNWNIPWILLVFSTTFAFILSPVLAIIEGLGDVKHAAKMRFLQQLVVAITAWIALISGTKLYAGGASNVIGLIVLSLAILFGKYRIRILKIWNFHRSSNVNYRQEILPYQWKIAVSWISGYLIYQLFNPVLFATQGAVVAGQMGMTITALNGVLNLSLSWMTTKVPLYSGLIAQKRYDELDSVFNRTLKQSVLINSAGLILLFVLIFILRKSGFSLGDRFLPYLPLIFMIIPVFVNQITASWATYLRCHKQEPFLAISVVGAITTSLSTIFLGKFFGVIGITAGYCLLTVCMGFTWGYIIFITKKREWHGVRT